MPRISDAMMRSINECRDQARATGAVIDVYQLASAMTAAHPEDNIALEDVMNYLIANGGSGVALQLPGRHAGPAAKGAKPVEFMLPVIEAEPEAEDELAVLAPLVAAAG